MTDKRFQRVIPCMREKSHNHCFSILQQLLTKGSNFQLKTIPILLIQFQVLIDIAISQRNHEEQTKSQHSCSKNEVKNNVQLQLLKFQRFKRKSELVNFKLNISNAIFQYHVSHQWNQCKGNTGTVMKRDTGNLSSL